ncbi:hypothetical protein BpHYR1_053861 [Brachionus plicatilis]|uniref:Uncharacterized protein n=1 Tax=Brachionus plicatilis TaxID=10195 RepID=A0A3M7QCY2_BRAPC|nr:hypothetical protein BpHYR1_053861 [Brachionus plicatilis]
MKSSANHNFENYYQDFYEFIHIQFLKEIYKSLFGSGIFEIMQLYLFNLKITTRSAAKRFFAPLSKKGHFVQTYFSLTFSSLELKT